MLFGVKCVAKRSGVALSQAFRKLHRLATISPLLAESTVGPEPRLYLHFYSPIPHCAHADMRLYSLAFCLLPLLTHSASVDQLVLSGQNMPEITETPIVRSTLSDLLTIEHSASIFFSYARETELSQLFQDKDAGTTLLVPTNKAVMALARKPYVPLSSLILVLKK